MIRVRALTIWLAITLLLPTAAAAQTATIPPPGTFNDDSKPLKSAADGPPRSLIRIDAPAVPKQTLLADSRKIP
jgi:hypothetical protein